MERPELEQTVRALVDTLDARGLGSPAYDATIRPREPGAAPPFAGTGASLRLGTTIGRGGMGVVRLAEQIALSREVAVKTVRDELREDAEAIARLVREARVTSLVEHPNVVPLYGLVRGDDDRPQMIMKRIEGVPWQALIHDPAHPEMPRDAVEPLLWHVDVLMRVCDAIHYAHSRGIVHLDVKPENVMIGRFREVYLVDWGIAASTRESHRGVLPLARELRDLVGTPAYMAPELLTPASRPPDERTDVYLLAATLYEIVAGAPPHRGGTLAEVLASILAADPELPADAPPELASILRRGLARDPAARFGSAEELRSALAQFVAHRGSARLAERALVELEALERMRAVPAAGATSTRSAEEAAHRLGECLFGFRAALREWPENEVARRGLARAIAGAARRHLEAGETSAAEAVLSDLEGAHDEHRDELLALRARAAAEAARGRELRRLGREQDLSPGLVRRAIGLVITIFVLNVGAVWMWTSAVDAGVVLGWDALIGESIALLAVSLIGLGVWRRYDVTEASRRLTRTFVVLIAALLIARLGERAMGYSVEQALTNDTFLIALCAATTGVLIDRRAWAAAAFLVAGWVLMIVAPAHLLIWLFASSFLGVAAMALLWVRGAPP